MSVLELSMGFIDIGDRCNFRDEIEMLLLEIKKF